MKYAEPSTTVVPRGMTPTVAYIDDFGFTPNDVTPLRLAIMYGNVGLKSLATLASMEMSRLEGIISGGILPTPEELQNLQAHIVPPSVA